MTKIYKIPKIQWKGNPSGFITTNTIREYVIRPNSATNPESSKRHVVCYNGKPQTYWNTMAEAREWVETVNYPSVVAEYLEPVSEPVSDILDWFKLAKPNPTDKDKCTQIGCHYEEVAEMSEAITDIAISRNLNTIATDYKKGHRDVFFQDKQGKQELLDSLCDQIVTALGVGYMFGFDMQAALKEVIRSNWSKFENCKPIFDENGKIAKPASYSKPNLEPFLGVSHDAD